MKPHAKVRITALKPKSSIKLCEEKYACKTSKTESHFFCEDCKTHQCDLCEALLHEDERLILHARILVDKVSEDILCDGDCQEKNYADVSCQACKSKFCYICDRIAHSTKSKKTHARARFLHEPETFLSCENLSQGSDTSFEEEMFSMTDDISSNVESPVIAPKLSLECFSLLSDKEQLQVKDEEEFIKKLKCDKNAPLKVVSIFGNTGDGKSYTFNHTFFGGKEVFLTSPLQASCTVGVWAALCPELGVITIDTEGFLGQSSNPNNRARMLLKVLAISDVIVYRTRAERLHDDMFSFLGDASSAYSRHFSLELKDASSRTNIDGPLSLLGPAVIIFHETSYTKPYSQDAEVHLRTQFHQMGLNLDAFSSFDYVGVHTSGQSTDFEPFKKVVKKHVDNLSVRVARSPGVIFKMLKVLCEKFSGNLDKNVPNTFPDQYFTCPVRCSSCNSQCSDSMNHSKNGSSHSSTHPCVFQHRFDNKIRLCKACLERGEVMVVKLQAMESNNSLLYGFAQYAWSGQICECPRCGIIYRSREYWYGNQDPEGSCLQTMICHVWPDNINDFNINTHTAQQVIDNIGSMAKVVSNIGAKPTKIVCDWVADQIAPTYWMSNAKIEHCGQCSNKFSELDTKHHCRSCGGGFCDACSSQRLLLACWGSSAVRVCDKCFEKYQDQGSDALIDGKDPPPEVTARKIGEFLHHGISSIVSYPAGLIKSSARPTYWVPDEDLIDCMICKTPFSRKVEIHHCRACGQGICNPCSLSRKPVPLRGWKSAVRVCDTCVKDL